MPTNYLRGGQRGRQLRADRGKREERESFASHNEASGRYPSKEYPSDSYYTVNEVYRQYVRKEGPKRPQ
jgi:hypothetical protein